MSTKKKVMENNPASKQRYACNICEKTFARKWNLSNHFRIHKKTRPRVKCAQCSSKFFDLPNLRRHCLIYHPKLSLSKSISKLKWKLETQKLSMGMPACTICHKSFAREENLQKHMASYHPDQQSRHINKNPDTKLKCSVKSHTKRTRYQPSIPNDHTNKNTEQQLSRSVKLNTERTFEKIRSNKYISIKKSALKKSSSKCDCSADSSCGADCINRMLFIQCISGNCVCDVNCTNNKFQALIPISIEVFITPDKGWGVKTKSNIDSGSFIIQYVGDVISEREYKHRLETQYSNDLHHYAIYLEAGFLIDARNMGNESRFFNHSCQPNCIVQKWVVKNLPCVAIFAVRNISAGEELTIDYNFHSYNDFEEKACKCYSNNCTGSIGKKVINKNRI